MTLLYFSAVGIMWDLNFNGMNYLKLSWDFLLHNYTEESRMIYSTMASHSYYYYLGDKSDVSLELAAI